MKFTSSKEFSFPMETAWQALHKTSSLDVSPGSEVTVISDSEWQTRLENSKGDPAVTKYSASYDEEKKIVTIEGVSDQKKGHDFIYLTLEEVADESVKLSIEVEIDTGMHLIAKALGAVFLKPMEQIMCRHIYKNFEALCSGKEAKRMSKDELDHQAKDFFSK